MIELITVYTKQVYLISPVVEQFSFGCTHLGKYRFNFLKFPRLDCNIGDVLINLSNIKDAAFCKNS